MTESVLKRIIDDGLPRHVALVMDGNGRWATRRGLDRSIGHHAGVEAVERLVRFVGKHLPLECLTLFAFSSENWNRPQAEVDQLMTLLEQFLYDKLDEFADAGIRLRILGDVAGLPPSVQRACERAVERTKNGTNLRLAVALNYGSRGEVVRACRAIVDDVVHGRLTGDAIDEYVVRRNLYTAGMPDPDLVVRTSGEYRLSNFLLWQSAYAELYFCDVLWPDFRPHHLIEAVEEFQKRERRFGAAQGA